MAIKLTSGTDAINNGHPLTFAMSVEGLEGTGKTRFGLLTCPTPIVHLNFGDRDPTPLLYDIPPERNAKIRLGGFQAKSTDGWTRDECREALRELAETAKEELSDGKMAGGTFILDSGSTWWDAMQEVYVAPEQEKRDASGGKRRGGLEYTKANLIVRGVLTWIRSQGAFLVITHTKTQEWDKEGPIPGKYKAKLNNAVPYIVDVRLDLTKTCAECGAPDCKSHMGRKHWGQLVKFGRDTSLEGMKFESPTFSFLYRLYTKQEYPRPEALE